MRARSAPGVPRLETWGWNNHEVRLRGLWARPSRETHHMRSRNELYVHLVWATWDRQPLLTPDRRDLIYRAIATSCADLRCEVLAIGGMPDHVHLLVRIPPSVAPAALVKQVKGASSHLANPVHGRGATFRWQGGYGAFTVSRHHVARVRGYVLNQERHHAENRLAPDFELPPVDKPSSTR